MELKEKIELQIKAQKILLETAISEQGRKCIEYAIIILEGLLEG